MGCGDSLGIGEGSDSYIQKLKPEELRRSLRESLKKLARKYSRHARLNWEG